MLQHHLQHLSMMPASLPLSSRGASTTSSVRLPDTPEFDELLERLSQSQTTSVLEEQLTRLSSLATIAPSE